VAIKSWHDFILRKVLDQLIQVQFVLIGKAFKFNTTSSQPGVVREAREFVVSDDFEGDVFNHSGTVIGQNG
jgi:hypothetical protein